MREDRRNAAYLARRLGPPRGRVKLFEKDLVHPLISSKDPNRSLSEWSMDLRWTHNSSSIFHLGLQFHLEGAQLQSPSPLEESVILTTRGRKDPCDSSLAVPPTSFSQKFQTVL